MSESNKTDPTASTKIIDKLFPKERDWSKAASEDAFEQYIRKIVANTVAAHDEMELARRYLARGEEIRRLRKRIDQLVPEVCDWRASNVDHTTPSRQQYLKEKLESYEAAMREAIIEARDYGPDRATLILRKALEKK